MRKKTQKRIILLATVASLMTPRLVYGDDIKVVITNEPYEISTDEYVEQDVRFVNYYENIKLSETDCEALVQVIYWEAARCGCNVKVCEAVVQTVFNRVLSPVFPNTVYDVIHQRGQFVTTCYFGSEVIPDGVSEIIDDAISEVLNGGIVLLGTDYVYFSTTKQTIAKDHVWVGEYKADGRPLKGKGMYFGKSK